MISRKTLAIALALGAMSAMALVPITARAHDCDDYQSAYCSDHDYSYGYRDRDYRDRDDYGYRDYGYRHRYRRYDDADYRGGGGDRGYGYACDPDGDRCYRSSSGYWNYHEYYRTHGYHWN